MGKIKVANVVDTLYAAAGMKRETAAAIVAKLYETYKDKIDLEQKAYGLTGESAEADCLTTSR